MSAENNGGKTTYYDVPEGAETLNDLIEHKDMPFWRGEIFKAAYRINGKDNTTVERELNKIIYYANRGLNEAKKKRKQHAEVLI